MYAVDQVSDDLLFVSRRNKNSIFVLFLCRREFSCRKKPRDEIDCVKAEQKADQLLNRLDHRGRCRNKHSPVFSLSERKRALFSRCRFRECRRALPESLLSYFCRPTTGNRVISGTFFSLSQPLRQAPREALTRPCLRKKHCRDVRLRRLR